MYDDFYEEHHPEYDSREEDPWVQKAIPYIKELFKEDKDEVFYTRELQVHFEKIDTDEGITKFFHWITYHALNHLVNQGFLKRSREKFEINGLKNIVVFYRHYSNRYFKRRRNVKIDLIQKNSRPEVTRECGNHAEDLFEKAFFRKGFEYIDDDVNEFEEKKWTKTEHDLDLCLEKDGIVYGIEIKNRFGYIDKDELNKKIEMCEYLGIKPVFIMRGSPATYNKKIIEEGGIALIFESRIFPPPYSGLVNKIKKETLFQDNVIVTRKIPDGIMKRFISLHVKNL